MIRHPRANIRLLGLAGSLRMGSLNRALLEAGRALTPEGTTLTVYEQLGDVPLFNEDLEARTPRGVTQLREAIEAADALVIATPEYNQAVPGVLKNAIDWMSRSDPEQGFGGKPVAVIGATAGPWGTRIAQSQLRQILIACQANVLVGPNLYLRHAREAFDRAGALTERAAQQQLKSVIHALVDWTRLVSPPSELDTLSRVS